MIWWAFLLIYYALGVWVTMSNTPREVRLYLTEHFPVQYTIAWIIALNIWIIPFTIGAVVATYQALFPRKGN